MKIAALAFLLLPFAGQAQLFKPMADSIRKAYHIPAIGYAVVSADSILQRDNIYNALTLLREAMEKQYGN